MSLEGTRAPFNPDHIKSLLTVANASEQGTPVLDVWQALEASGINTGLTEAQWRNLQATQYIFPPGYGLAGAYAHALVDNGHLTLPDLTGIGEYYADQQAISDYVGDLDIPC